MIAKEQTKQANEPIIDRLGGNDMTKKQTKRAYNTLYCKQNYKRLGFKLRLKEDAELIEHLQSKCNLQEYLRELVRADYLQSK